MSKLDYTYSVNDDVITVMDQTIGGASITNAINEIATQIKEELELSHEAFRIKHFIYCNHRGKYNGARFNKNGSVQFFSLNATSEAKAIEYLKRLKAIHP